MMPLFVLPFPAINPVLLEIGPFQLRWYALGYIFGILAAWWYSRRLVADTRLWGPAGPPLTPSHLDDLVVYATIGIVAGGRIGYVLVYDLQAFLGDPLQIFALWNGGMSFHGGFLGTILAMVIFAWRRKIPVWSLIDSVAPGVPFGIFFVRITNFINGELWGRPTDVPWAMVFPTGGPEPRHPSQLYEAFLEGVVLFVLLRYLTHGQKRLQQPGFVSGAFAAWYGLSRTFVEFFRQPDAQIGDAGLLAGGITMGMLLSAPMIVAGIGTMLWASRRRPLPAE